MPPTGRSEALHGIDLAVANGSVLALLGPNGAGKSTTLARGERADGADQGVLPRFLGRHVNGMRPDKLARAGVCTLPDGRGIFPNLTVTENLRLMTFGGPSPIVGGGHGLHPVPAAVGSPSPGGGDALGRRAADARHRAHPERRAGGPPPRRDLHGPGADDRRRAYGLVAQIAAEGVAVILAEQFAATALGVATDVAVVVQGRIVAAGSPDVLPDDLAERVSRRCCRMKFRSAVVAAAVALVIVIGTGAGRCTVCPPSLPACLLVGGGAGLLSAAFVAGAAGADAALGLASPRAAWPKGPPAQYEQPNFPLPATPSLEFDEGYAATTDNFGPTGTATASSLYPGQVVANAGPELALLAPGVPLPPAPVWPVQATSEYPQAPNSGSTDETGVNMDASSTTNGNTATATLGDDAATAGANGADPTQQAPAGTGNPLAGSSSIFGIGGMSATSSSQAPSTSANAQASATDTGISILGGFITIGSVTSTATATSDGTTGKVTGATAVQNMDISGEQVTVDANGIAAAGQSAPMAIPISTLNAAAQTARHLHGGDQRHRHGQWAVGEPDPRRGRRTAIDLKMLDSPLNSPVDLVAGVRHIAAPCRVRPTTNSSTSDPAPVQVQLARLAGLRSRNSGDTGTGVGSVPRFRRLLRSRLRHRQLGQCRIPGHHGHRGDYSGGTGSLSPSGSGFRAAGLRPRPVGADLGHRAGLQGNRRRADPPRAAGRPPSPMSTSAPTRPASYSAPRARTAAPSWSASPPRPTTSPCSEERTMTWHLPGRTSPDPNPFRYPLTGPPSSAASPTATAWKAFGAGAARAGAVHPGADALRRLAAVVDRARPGRNGRNVRKWMETIGMVLIVFGFVFIVLGWYGAAHSPYLYQEVFILISGGLLGVALVIGGRVFVHCAWKMRKVEEDRCNALAIVRSVTGWSDPPRPDETGHAEQEERAGEEQRRLLPPSCPSPCWRCSPRLGVAPGEAGRAGPGSASAAGGAGGANAATGNSGASSGATRSTVATASASGGTAATPGSAGTAGHAGSGPATGRHGGAAAARPHRTVRRERNVARPAATAGPPGPA